MPSPLVNDVTDTKADSIVNIEGEFVALGPLRRDLIPIYQRWANYLHVGRNLSSIPLGPMTLEGETGWFDRNSGADSSVVTFTIYERATGRPIGTTSLTDIHDRNRTAEFGILIGEEDARGRGFGTETARLMLSYAFTAQCLHNVMLRVFDFNLAGQHAYRKAGFREFGRRRSSIMLGKVLHDVVYMECLASEFSRPPVFGDSDFGLNQSLQGRG